MNIVWDLSIIFTFHYISTFTSEKLSKVVHVTLVLNFIAFSQRKKIEVLCPRSVYLDSRSGKPIHSLTSWSLLVAARWFLVRGTKCMLQGWKPCRLHATTVIWEVPGRSRKQVELIFLVGGLEHGWIMTFHSVGNAIIPTDELHHFSEG